MFNVVDNVDGDGLFALADVRESRTLDGAGDGPLKFRPSRMRGQTADRITFVNRALARHRLDQWNRRDRIGPHAITFFYLNPRDDDPRNDELAIATRIFLDESDEDHMLGAATGPASAEAAGVADVLLLKILGALHGLAQEYERGPGFDPRSQMCQRVESMGPAATYMGIGASSVTFPNGPDAEPLLVGLVALADGTRMLVEGGNGMESARLQSTHMIGTGGMLDVRPWRWATSDFRDAGRGVQMAFPLLLSLHDAALTADRRDSGNRRPRDRRESMSEAGAGHVP